MDFMKMTLKDIPQVAKLYNELAYFIQSETRDDYFNFERLIELSIKDHRTTEAGGVRKYNVTTGSALRFLDPEFHPTRK